MDVIRKKMLHTPKSDLKVVGRCTVISEHLHDYTTIDTDSRINTFVFQRNGEIGIVLYGYRMNYAHFAPLNWWIKTTGGIYLFPKKTIELNETEYKDFRSAFRSQKAENTDGYFELKEF